MSLALVTTLVEDCPLEEAETQRIVAEALLFGGREGLRVGVVFAGDELMAELHGEFLGDPTTTDVITFDLGPAELPHGVGEEDAPLEAELYVGALEAQRVAAARGVLWTRELALYVTHGVLHLCGYDDHTDEDSDRMRTAEKAVMGTLGYPEDNAPHHM